MKIWPAIDIRAGKCVRLAQGDYDRQTTYGTNPADMALRWVNDGGTALHIVDLDGAKGDLSDNGESLNRSAIAEILEKCDVPCQIGGGIRSQSAITDYLELGAQRVVIGTRAIADTDWLAGVANDFPERLAVGIDARDGKVATDGWQKTTEVSSLDFARQISELPIGAIIYTDIAKDGMLSGPNFDAMHEMAQATSIPVIASGGVTTVQDIEKLATLGLSGCIIGRALYEGRITLPSALSASQQVAG
jgi:phosphoribosylformimino-5-aminoimidazole carboxamide ribotide isomerase